MKKTKAAPKEKPKERARARARATMKQKRSAVGDGGVVKKKTKTASGHGHPPYFQMIKEALLHLNRKRGSSRFAIADYIEKKYKAVLPSNFRKTIGIRLNESVGTGKLMKMRIYYKLADVEEKEEKDLKPYVNVPGVKRDEDPSPKEEEAVMDNFWGIAALDPYLFCSEEKKKKKKTKKQKQKEEEEKKREQMYKEWREEIGEDMEDMEEITDELKEKWEKYARQVRESQACIFPPPFFFFFSFSFLLGLKR